MLNAGGLKDYATSKNRQIHEMQEIWIDQITWRIVKERYRSENYIEEFEYTKFQLNPKVDEKLFVVDVHKEAS